MEQLSLESVGVADNSTLVLIVIELIGNPRKSEIRARMPSPSPIIVHVAVGASNEICAQGVRFSLEIRLSIRTKGAVKGAGVAG